MNIKQSFNRGLVTLAVLFYLDVIGFPVFFGEPIVILFSLLVGLFSFFFVRNIIKTRSTKISSSIGQGLIIGLVSGLGFAAVTYIFAQLQAQGIKVTEVFAQIKPESTAILTGLEKGDINQGVNVFPGLIRMVLFLTGGAVFGAVIAQIFTGKDLKIMQKDDRERAKSWSIYLLPIIFYILFLISRGSLVDFLDTEAQKSNLGLTLIYLFVGSALFALRGAKSKVEKITISIVVAGLVLVLPLLANQFQNAVLGAVMIFIVMGIGLNIVVGYAGLLDLGYVAFFAVGAYTYGLLSAPASFVVVSIPGFQGFNFWLGLPIAFIIGALTGVILGTPVLKMRGDYLAIVTLGFGEIIRLLVLNLRDFTGGPGGVLNIPPPVILGYNLGKNPMGILYLAMAIGVLVTIITTRMHESRLGRAWVALREDEDVAEAMGINLVAIKLLAFGSGAAFAALGGAVYAARQVNIFPDNFALDVSINVLSLIIIGGIGSIEGVVLGAIALIGLPEILRSVSEYRIIAFGALLVVMMIIRPEGFLPSTRRKRELHSIETEPSTAESGGD